MAREVAAITGVALELPQVGATKVTIPDCLTLRVEVPDACPRYAGRVVRGVRAAATTPEWMVQRLRRSGLSSISAIVDVTNYVLLELGQPLHAFDLAGIDGGITVRFARSGEALALLNQQTVTLSPDMLVIADTSRPLALAGILGGQSSAVSGASTDIFIESAFFDPAVIAGRGRRLNLSTDSSFRFERGVDFAATRAALERATQLIQEICGGAAGEIVEALADLPLRSPILLRTKRIARVLGIPLSAAEIEALLCRLQFDFSPETNGFRVVPPSYRFDLTIEADLIEEIARLHGYDNIPATPPKGSLNMLPEPEAVRSRDALFATLTARDYQEVINYSFVDAAWERDFAENAHPVALKNPISSQMGVMRSTLFGGLLDNLRFNLNRKQPRIRLFEAGRCFAAQQDGFFQPSRFAALCYGASCSEQWGEAPRPVDFFDMKADLEALLWPAIARFEAASHPALHPGQSAKVWRGDVFLGWIGALHPSLQQKQDLPAAPILFELDWDGLMEAPVPTFSEVSRTPIVRRDIAVVVEEEICVQTLLDAMKVHLPDSIIEIAPFDVYRGKGIDSGKKSIAFRVLMQDTQQTLTDEEVDVAVLYLTEILTSSFGAKSRI